MKTLSLIALLSLGTLGAGAGLSTTADCEPCEVVSQVKIWAIGLFQLEPAPLTVCGSLNASEVILQRRLDLLERGAEEFGPLEPFELPIYVPAGTSGSGVVVDRVEFRSAAVWAGACHYNGEYHHRGQTALLGFAFEGGAVDGVELAGLGAVVALASDLNLDEGAERQIEAWIDEDADEGQVAALTAWLGTEVGELDVVHRAAVEVHAGLESFGLVVPGVAEAAADTMAERACCSMPENRWYEPLAGPAGAPVGFVERCRFEGSEALEGWTYEGENSAFRSLASRP